MAKPDATTRGGVWTPEISFVFGIHGLCTYCGDPANTLDHVVPWSFMAFRDRPTNGGKASGIRTYACRECNSILGARFFPTFIERAVFVRDQLRKRYAKYLTIPAWEKDELRELRGNLRRAVEGAEFVAKGAKLRVGWLNNPTFWEIFDAVRERVSDETSPKYRDHVAMFFNRRAACYDDGESVVD